MYEFWQKKRSAAETTLHQQAESDPAIGSIGEIMVVFNHKVKYADGQLDGLRFIKIQF